MIVYKKTAILVRFKKNYYIEYQHWQAFRRYLLTFPSMRSSPPDAIKLWDKYLIYAAALGISKKIFKKFRGWNLITNKDYSTFTALNTSYIALSSSLGSSGGGGFGGGISAEGIGGGGGGR